MDELIKAYARLLDGYHELKGEFKAVNDAYKDALSRISAVEKVLSKLPNAEALDIITKDLADVKVVLAKGDIPFLSPRGRKVAR